MKTMGMYAALILSMLAAIARADAPPEALARSAGIGTKIQPFTASVVTVSGDKQATSTFDTQKAPKVTAYIMVGTHCPTTAKYVERFKELEKKYAGKDAEFIFVYPNRDDTSEAKVAFQKEHQFTSKLIDDQGGRIAKLLMAQRTSEIILVSKDGTILYRGSLDDASKDPAAVTKRYVVAALDEYLAGKPITEATSPVSA